MRQQNIVKEKSFAFSLQIIKLYKRLIHEKEYIISKPLLRSATSIGANIEMADAGYSKRDFTAKNVYRLEGGKGNKILAAIT